MYGPEGFFKHKKTYVKSQFMDNASLIFFFDSSPDPFFVPPTILFAVWLLWTKSPEPDLIFTGEVLQQGRL